MALVLRQGLPCITVHANGHALRVALFRTGRGAVRSHGQPSRCGSAILGDATAGTSAAGRGDSRASADPLSVDVGARQRTDLLAGLAPMAQALSLSFSSSQGVDLSPNSLEQTLASGGFAHAARSRAQPSVIARLGRRLLLQRLTHLPHGQI